METYNYRHLRDKLFDDFRLMIVDPPQKLESNESDILSSCFGTSRENLSNEVISKMVSTNLIKRWAEIKTPSHPRFFAMTPSENIYIKVCCIIMK